MRGEALLSKTFLETHPEEAAQILDRFSPEELAGLLGEGSTTVAASILERVNGILASETLALLSGERVRSLLRILPLSVGASMLRRMDSKTSQEICQSLPQGLLKPLNELLRFPENTAGAVMNPRVLTIPDDITANEAMGIAQRSMEQVIQYLYVVSRENVLLGVITLKELIQARPKMLVRSIMHTPVVRLPVYSNPLQIINHPGWKKYHKLPVVDDNGFFLGVIGYKVVRSLESKREIVDWQQEIFETTLSFGEMYWKGLSASFQLLAGLLTILKNRPSQ